MLRAAVAALALFVCACASAPPAEQPLIVERIGDAPADILAEFGGEGGPSPSTYIPSADEQRLIVAAFDALTPLHRRMLEQHLHSISFLNGLPNNALTAPAPGMEGQFNIIVRAGVLRETASQLLTNKERTCFDATGSDLSVSVDAGQLTGIAYVLLHEATHIADATLRISSTAEQTTTAFSEGVWQDRLTIAQAYRGELLPTLCYRHGRSPLRVERAQAAYEELSWTPFASLYASANWFDDAAELATWRHVTERLGEPYRLEVRRGAEVIYRYEPMRSDLVRSRLSLLDRFYEDEP